MAEPRSPEAQLSPTRILTATLLLAASAAAAQEQELSPQSRTSGRLRAIVTEIGTEAPLAGVAIRLTAGERPEVARLTDERGRAFFSDLPAGRYLIAIEQFGYGEARSSLDVRSGALTAVTVGLAPEVLELEPIVVSTTRRGADMGGFEQRRRMGFGHFVTRADLDSDNGRVSSLLRTIPGVQVTPATGAAGGGFLSMRGGCLPALVLDGVPLRRTTSLSIDEYLTPNEVEAIEVYRGVETPIRFANNSCGAVVVWTRVPEPSPPGQRSFWKRFLVAAGGLMTVALLLNP